MKIKPTSEKAKSAPKVSSRSHLGDTSCVPKLRFPHFTTPWETTPLSRLLRFQNGVNAPAEKYGRGVKFVSVSDIIQNDYVTYDNIVGSVDIDDATLERYSVENGDMVFQRSSETVEDIGRANVYLDNRMATFGGFVIRGKKIGEYNPYFFKCLLYSNEARRKVIRVGAGAQHYNIGQEALSQIYLHFPEMAEQRRIADLLLLVSNRIDAQRKLVELLKKHKRGLLRYVFEENIEGDYYSFSEIASRRNEKITPTKDSRLDCIELEHIEQETGMLLGSVPLSGQNSLKNLCKPSDIVFGKLRPYLRKFVFAENECAVSSETWVLVAAKGIYPKFLFYLIQSEPFMRAASVSSGTKMPRSEWSNVANAKFYVPDRTQQETIAACFSEIDRRILTSQRILTAAQAYKRGLLQQLFV